MSKANREFIVSSWRARPDIHSLSPVGALVVVPAILQILDQSRLGSRSTALRARRLCGPVASGSRGNYLVRFSTFLNPEGTANVESSTGPAEKPLISVVASISEPGLLLPCC